MKPAAQSAVVAQLVLQLVAPQMNGEHDDMVPGTQSPVPSQVLAPVCTPPVHVGLAQAVPAEYSTHAPAPLQTPVVPHVDAGMTAHWLLSGKPEATLPQTPSVP